MERLCILVVTPMSRLGRYVRRLLPAERFDVIDARPGPEFVEAVYRASPHIAVLDRIEKRCEAVKVEIMLLKKRRNDVEVIVVSDRSSAKDASVVELGVFYYLAGRSKHALIRVIAAAAEAFSRRREQAKGQPDFINWGARQ